ncbi:GAF domain-containing SpoIIE family protein phosphatase [Leptospira borgpetersenii]|uniref:GAF domain-containing SpoIIE family protein phosphatase n=1 Tax=Leptospira borgpetersenii TaxID=174 RepID=UPI0020220CF1|nr:GAF domain-containing SpoIIE family protein phosphatase [Leptospira borgpetersenii]URD70628.1 SpoIIE family protein phosphatase [Leptospira borgpetersenii]UVD73804.1 SpoIIE family protein phosphatase [Leptospira borgpetersenii]UVD76997.1 SpoIIE family protein phosphatase [Leptospira borgpetersenii]UZW33561.1 SpoIIE family protein phosphatase [Leptospira borgpetersenii]
MPQTVLESLKLKSILSTSTILNANLDLYQLLPLIMLYSKDLLEADASSLFLLDETEEFLYCEVALGEKGEIIQKYGRLDIGEGIAGWVAKEKKPIILEDAYSDSRFNPSWDQKTGYRTRSLVCVPLFIENKIIGTLEILNKTQNRSFNACDLNYLTSLSEVAAIAIQNAKIHENLKKRILELSLLYEFEKLIVSEKSIHELGSWVLERVLEFLEAKTGTIYIADHTSQTLRILAAKGIPKDAIHTIIVPFGEGVAGWVAKERKNLLIQNLEEDKRYNLNVKYKFEANSLISSPLIYKDELLGVISVNNKKSGFTFHKNDLEMLGAIANRLSMTIKNADLFHKVVDSDRELQRAREVMSKVIPTTIPYIKGLEVGAEHIPYSNVGGDFYSIFKLDSERTGFLVADVSGHGLSASVIATVMNTIISTYDKEILSSPSQFFSGLNHALNNKMVGNFVTAFYCVIDTKKDTILYSNAGHNHPLLLQNSTDSMISLETKGKLIGIIPDLFFEEKSIHFKIGDRLVLYTDGISEHYSDDRTKRYSEEFISISIHKCASKTAQETSAQIISDCIEYCNYSKFSDDVTLLVIDRK